MESRRIPAQRVRQLKSAFANRDIRRPHDENGQVR
jgi:hypothetical protein